MGPYFVYAISQALTLGKTSKPSHHVQIGWSGYLLYNPSFAVLLILLAISWLYREPIAATV
jgi:hypothetical protein